MAVIRKARATRMLQPGEKLDNTIFDANGQELLKAGAILNDYFIKGLLARGITQVFTIEGEPDVLPPGLEFVAPAVREAVKKERVPDKKNVEMSEEVKQRVSAGINFIFTDTKNEALAQNAETVSGELVDTVLNSDAVAMDIEKLKVSDEYTFKHSVDVAVMALVVGKSMQLPPEELRELGTAGLLHDIGKRDIRKEVLNKPGRLTEEEFALMKQHTLKGLKILRETGKFSHAIEMGVLQHHEKMNGRGYPMGLSRDSVNPGIHKFARIISVVDVYDALVTERPYKKGFKKSTAYEMLLGMGDDLDPDVFKHFSNSLIIYPVDSRVYLSNGEEAIVVSNNAGYPHWPVVVGLKTGRKYDLANDASVMIQESDMNDI